MSAPCSFCKGTGKHPYFRNLKCNACRGTGVARPINKVHAETMAKILGRPMRAKRFSEGVKPPGKLMKLNDEQGAAGIELNANRNSFGYCIDEVNDDLHEIDFVSLLGIPWFCYYEDPGEPTSRWFFTEPEFRQIIKHADL